MLEFMDSVAINVVEYTFRMDLDREAVAMLVANSDEFGHTGTEHTELITALFAKKHCNKSTFYDLSRQGRGVCCRPMWVQDVIAMG